VTRLKLRVGRTRRSSQRYPIVCAAGSATKRLDSIAMPIKSKAQRRKFAELLVEGKISPETFEEWNRAAGNADLPERLHPKVVVKPKRRIRAKRAAKPKIARAKKGGRLTRKRGRLGRRPATG
jgi:hypothetical protein